MIDLDGIDGRCNACKDFRSSLDTYFTIDEIMDLSRLLRQAEKDAARYRELRDAESETCVEFINAKARMASPEWLDGLVDAYINASNN